MKRVLFLVLLLPLATLGAPASATDDDLREVKWVGKATATVIDGKRLLVSDSTAAQVIEYSIERTTLGQRLRTFPTGETPQRVRLGVIATP